MLKHAEIFNKLVTKLPATSAKRVIDLMEDRCRDSISNGLASFPALPTEVKIFAKSVTFRRNDGVKFKIRYDAAYRVWLCAEVKE